MEWYASSESVRTDNGPFGKSGFASRDPDTDLVLYEPRATSGSQSEKLWNTASVVVTSLTTLSSLTKTYWRRRARP